MFSVPHARLVLGFSIDFPLERQVALGISVHLRSFSKKVFTFMLWIGFLGGKSRLHASGLNVIDAEFHSRFAFAPEGWWIRTRIFFPLLLDWNVFGMHVDLPYEMCMPHGCGLEKVQSFQCSFFLFGKKRSRDLRIES